MASILKNKDIIIVKYTVLENTPANEESKWSNMNEMVGRYIHHFSCGDKYYHTIQICKNHDGISGIKSISIWSFELKYLNRSLTQQTHFTPPHFSIKNHHFWLLLVILLYFHGIKDTYVQYIQVWGSRICHNF